MAKLKKSKGERILILGTTGVEKEQILRQLKTYASTQKESITFEIEDFEKTYLKEALDDDHQDEFDYMDEKNDIRQRELWSKGWNKFKPRISKFKDKHIILCLHGVITRSFTGTRSPVDILCLRDFAPTKIITLIDNVYLKWFKTQDRAKRKPIGKPTLEQLLDARRVEILIGDLIAGHQETKPYHYVLSTQHPARTLYRLLFGGKDVIPVYLSFPIAAPRTLKKNEGNDSGISEINSFLKDSNEFENKNPKVACFCPLTIDELPLTNYLDDYLEKNREKKIEEGEMLEFPLDKMWKVREFWKDEILLCKPEGYPPTISFPLSQVQDAKGLIKSDVRLRDYRLVMQSRRLAVFNPWFNGQETAGVQSEIRKAVYDKKSVLIYQNPSHDQLDLCKKEYGEKPTGAMGEDILSSGATLYQSVDVLFKSLL